MGEKQWEASIDVNRNTLHFFIKDITINIVFVDNITLAVKYRGRERFGQAKCCDI